MVTPNSSRLKGQAFEPALYIYIGFVYYSPYALAVFLIFEILSIRGLVKWLMMRSILFNLNYKNYYGSRI